MPIVGVDEVGRGPLAGPVIAAAIVLEDEYLLSCVKDSKKLSPKRRDALFMELEKKSHWAIGSASVEEIDTINILQASLLAMKRAVDALNIIPSVVWIDGNQAPKMPYNTKCFIGGDATVPLISAASIMAKVVRDRMMVELALSYPGYGFERHKGYPTPDHLQALERLGITSLHRRSFRPVQAWIDKHG